MTGIISLSQNIDWATFLNHDAIEDTADRIDDFNDNDMESSYDFSLDSEELYEDEESSETEAGGHFDNYFGNESDETFDLELENSPTFSNDFSDILPKYERFRYDNLKLEVQNPQSRKRSVSISETTETKKIKCEKKELHEEVDLSESEDEINIDGINRKSTPEEKLTKMIAGLEPKHLKKAIEIMSDKPTHNCQELKFDLSKMNQSKLLKLYEFVSKCKEDEIDDELLSDESVEVEEDSTPKSKEAKTASSLPSTRPCTPSIPSPTHLPNTSSLSNPQKRSPSILSSIIPNNFKSVFSQNKIMEERLKNIIKTETQPSTKKVSPKKRSKEEDEEEIDIMG